MLEPCEFCGGEAVATMQRDGPGGPETVAVCAVCKIIYKED